MRFFYELSYLIGFKPWDSGVPPPELVAVVEGPDALARTRALDLGCGTGTNAIYLAQHGWDVTAIDLVRRPLAAARRKAAAAGVAPRFVRGDVTRLVELGVGEGYGLGFDLGCFHGLPVERRDAYVRGLTAVTVPGAVHLLFGFAPGAMRPGPAGVSPAEVRERFRGWELQDATRGTDQIEAWWYRLRRLG